MKSGISGRIVAVGFLYLGLALLVFGMFTPSLVPTSLVFVAANAAVSLLFVFLYRPRTMWLVEVTIYLVFVLIYVVKGIVHGATGLDSLSQWISLRSALSEQGYLEALWKVTGAHVVVAGMVLATNHLGQRPRARGASYRLDDKWIRLVLVAIVIWLVVSSVVMVRYGVALMGTDGVALPYKLSGVFFYSRIVAIPMILFYLLERSLREANRPLLMIVISELILLALLETYVRASKSPVLVLTLQGAFLYVWSNARAGGFKIRLKPRVWITAILFGALLYPLADNYRRVVVEEKEDRSILAETIRPMTGADSGYFMTTFWGIFNRTLGFPEFAELSANSAGGVSPLEAWNDGIGLYYTKYHLGFMQEGHSSSPSLLGACWLFGGPVFWILLLAGYLLVVLVGFRLVDRMTVLGGPVAALLSFELLNSLMAGTVDSSAFRVGVIFVVAGMFSVFVRLAGYRWSEPWPGRTLAAPVPRRGRQFQ